VIDAMGMLDLILLNDGRKPTFNKGRGTLSSIIIPIAGVEDKCNSTIAAAILWLEKDHASYASKKAAVTASSLPRLMAQRRWP